ncbi:MAG: hypothetical protein ABIO39_09345 [Caulobacteraceae bacterium]
MPILSASDEPFLLTPLDAARAKLAEPVPADEPVLKLLFAAALAAMTALMLAATVILALPASGPAGATPPGVAAGLKR